jgi:NADPH:quinone reductase-like Zn-dependent oxidoreductase
LPDPVPAAGEVVVDIHAASVNAADWKMRAGQHSAGIDFPHVPGRDFSGIVAALGKGATDFKVGDAVFGVCEVPREGAYAEKITIVREILARKPASLTHVQCASTALAGLTALISVEDTIEMIGGETILIHDGAGGVGGFAIALAKHLGARVVSTASAANHDHMRALGADETMGGSAPASPRPDATLLRPKVNRDRPHLARIAALVVQGVVPLPTIVEYPLAEAAAAHRVSEARHLRGKPVFRVR